MKNFRPYNEHPKELTISEYWVGNYRGLLRKGLPWDHQENLYNWFRRTYPDLDPEYYDIEKPERYVISTHKKDEK